MRELFQNVLTASFHGSIVILVVMLLRLVLKKTPKKFFCMLWLLAGVRLLMPFEIQSSMSLQPNTAAVVEERWQAGGEVFPDLEPDFLMGGVVEPEGQTVDAPVFGNDTVTMVSSAPAASAPAENPVPDASASPIRTADKPAVDWVALVPYFWIAVMGCFALSCIYSYLRLRYQVREAVKIPGGWECDRIETAFILGFIKPQIYIPMGMSASNRKYILAHERTHLEKGDHWFKMIGYLALAVHWFNPLVWAAYILLCKDIEMACDERVVQFMDLEERKHYSAALLNCSTNRAHFAACPVAFGEVSVKSRIKSVLNYRKPSFWISLLGVIAIIFVAVCLVTSPVENGEGPAAGETTPTEEMAAGQENGFASGLSESEIAYTCEQAIEELKNRESYCVQVVNGGESTNPHHGIASSTTMIRRSGDNTMTVNDGGEAGVNGSLYFEGISASNWGDVWVKDESTQTTEPDAWLSHFSPSEKKVTFPEGTGVRSADTVSFAAEWTEGIRFEQEYSGIFTFTFHEDGTLASFSADYVYVIEEEDGGGEMRYTQTATVLEENPEETYNQIKACADQAVTEEEVVSIRRERQSVTEVPSNKTDYDKDFMLGSGQMGWQFMDGEWFFKFGAEDVTETSARLLIEYNGPYGNNTIGSGTVTSGDTYFIEQLVDNVWVEVPRKGSAASIEKMSLPAGASQSINWESAYGKLPGGFYRIGNYYTFTSSSGETDTKVCYAKFRLYDPEMGALLTKCRNGLSGLLASDSYHLLATHWMPLNNSNSDDFYYTSEVWKHGSDYLEENLYYYYADNSLRTGRSTMRRDGIYYDLEHVNDSCRNSVSSWSTNTYADEDNFQIWSWTYELYDANVYDITQEGREIRVLEMSNFYDGIPYIETVFTFDNEENLVALSRAYVYENGDRLVDDEMTLFDDTSEKIGAFIDGQDLSSIATFSYAEDVAKYSNSDGNVRTKNFVNTTAKTISGPLDAIDIAIKDCTLPAAGGLEPGTNKSDVFYDAEAKMWKVEFTASWDSSICQAVYINNQGITQMTVTMELEVDY